MRSWAGAQSPAKGAGSGAAMSSHGQSDDAKIGSSPERGDRSRSITQLSFGTRGSGAYPAGAALPLFPITGMPATAAPFLALLSLVLLAVSAVANDAVPTGVAPVPVHVHHRVHIPGQDPSPFTLKGTVLLTPNGPSYAPAVSFRDDLTAWASSNDPHARYEVALQTEESPETWPRSSVKLCYVTAAKDEYLTMHKTVSGDVFALDYHLSSVPKDGACPSTPSSLFIASTDVLLKSPSPAFSPRLKTPPPLGPDGQTIKPIAEKSFIQKYWMYIVPALIILLVMPAGPEEGGQQS